MQEPRSATADLQGPQVATLAPDALATQAKERVLVHVNELEGGGKGAPARLDIDVNALIDSIMSAIHGNKNREAFVRAALESTKSTIRGRHNIMIFNMQQNFDFNPDWNNTWFTSREFQGILYGFWVFKGPARFVNQGDGGWINWGFYGWFRRDGGTVDFSAH